MMLTDLVLSHSIKQMAGWGLVSVIVTTVFLNFMNLFVRGTLSLVKIVKRFLKIRGNKARKYLMSR